MYHTITEFANDWGRDSASTLRLLRLLTDDSLGQKVTPEGRSLGRIAWHITSSIIEMGNIAGLLGDEPPLSDEPPASAAEIADTYERISNALLTAVKTQWTDSTLAEERFMYGEMWKNGFTIQALMGHEIHHRGQMTVLMRQAGLPVVGVYGPSKEEWTQFGSPPAP
jgi:uncharacterized damage-inducible protein DinB